MSCNTQISCQNKCASRVTEDDIRAFLAQNGGSYRPSRILGGPVGVLLLISVCALFFFLGTQSTHSAEQQHSNALDSLIQAGVVKKKSEPIDGYYRNYAFWELVGKPGN